MLTPSATPMSLRLPSDIAKSTLSRYTAVCALQDELIERLGGVDAVAEMSGRRRRMVKQPNGTYKYCVRSSGEGGLDKVRLPSSAT